MAVAPRIPLPPQPVMPPEGIAPVTDPASTGTAPDASPTTLVLQYLKQRGYQPSSENVRRALEANQRDPGVIPGLRSDRPATEAEDQAAMAAAGKGGGGRGGGRGLPVPPIPPSGQGPTTPPDRSDNQNTSAAPTDGGSGVGPLGMSILAGLPAGAAMYGASKIPALGGGAGPMPPVAPVDPTAIPGTAPLPRQAMPQGPGDQGQIDYSVLPPEGQNLTDMQRAISRGVPGDVAPTLPGVQPVGPPGAADMGPPRGPVEPVAPQMPPLKSATGGRPAPTLDELAKLQALIHTSPNLHLFTPKVPLPKPRL